MNPLTAISAVFLTCQEARGPPSYDFMKPAGSRTNSAPSILPISWGRGVCSFFRLVMSNFETVMMRLGLLGGHRRCAHNH